MLLEEPKKILYITIEYNQTTAILIDIILLPIYKHLLAVFDFKDHKKLGTASK